MRAGNFCGLKPLLFGQKCSRIEMVKSPRLPRVPRKAFRGPKMERSRRCTGNFILMMELRKKIFTFRDIIDLPPCDGTESLNELITRTMKDLHKFHPEIVSRSKLLQIRRASFDKILVCFCEALKNIGDSWMPNQDWIDQETYDKFNTYDKINSEKIVEMALAMFNLVINIAKEKFDIMDEDERSRYLLRTSSFGRLLVGSSTESNSSYSASPITPTSVLPPQFIGSPSSDEFAHISVSSPLLRYLRIQAVGKLNPIDIKRLAFHIPPNVGAWDNSWKQKNNEEGQKMAEMEAENQKNNEDEEMMFQMEASDNSQVTEAANADDGDKDCKCENVLPEISTETTESSEALPPAVPKSNVVALAAPPPPPPPPPTIIRWNVISSPPQPTQQPNSIVPPPPRPVQFVPEPKVSTQQKRLPPPLPPPPLPILSLNLEKAGASSSASVSPLPEQPPTPPPSPTSHFNRVVDASHVVPCPPPCPPPPPPMVPPTVQEKPSQALSPPVKMLGTKKAAIAPPTPPPSPTSHFNRVVDTPHVVPCPPPCPAAAAPPPPMVPPTVQEKQAQALSPPVKMLRTKKATITPPPPPMVPPNESMQSSPRAPPMPLANGAAPPPPPPPMASTKGSMPLTPPTPPMPLANGVAPPPPMPQVKGAAPLPPPLGAGRSLRPRKAQTKLRRSSEMGKLYRALKGKVEGGNPKAKSANGRRSSSSSGGGSGQGMADALAEMTKRSAYFQQIEEDVQKYSKSIAELKTTISAFNAKDMTELIQFHKKVESVLEKLTDESQVLARCDSFPDKKLEALRTAAALYSKLNGIVSELQSLKITSPLGQLLDKIERYFNKVKGEIDTLERTKDEESKKFQSHNINFDFHILVQIKEAMVDVSSSCMELALKERRETKEHNKATTKLLWRAFQFAFKVYSFAGGHDERADSLTRELAHEIETDSLITT